MSREEDARIHEDGPKRELLPGRGKHAQHFRSVLRANDWAQDEGR